MAAKEFKTTIVIDADLQASVEKALDSVGGNIEDLKKAVQAVAPAFDKLSDEINAQEAVLKAAKRQYASYIVEGKQSSRQAEELAGEIKRLSATLKTNRTTMAAAERAANDLGEEFEDAEKDTDDLSDSAKDSKGGFTVMKGAMANLVSDGIKAFASACKGAIASVYGLAESTMEYREDMAKLETAFQSVGHSSAAATETYKTLYSVFGEEDRAVEAAQQIARLAKSEEEMAVMTNIATGAWATWGDSLATESLMEAMNSTAKIGTVQGTLADALEWSGVNLDSFNESLSQMSTEDEQAAYIMDTLNRLYSDAADIYRDNNSAIIDARKINSKYTDSLAELGDLIQPVANATKGGLNTLLGAAVELMEGADLEGFAAGIAEAFEALAPVISDLVEQALPFVNIFLDGIKELLPQVVPLIGQLGSVLGPILEAVVAVMPVIMDLLNAIIPMVVDIVSAILPTLTQLIKKLTPFFVQITEMILPVLLDVIDQLMPLILQVTDAILPVILNLVEQLTPIFMQMTEQILPIIIELINRLLPIIIQITEAIIPIIAEILAALMPMLMNSVETILPLIFELLSSILPVLEPIMALVATLTDAILPVLVKLTRPIIPIITTISELLEPLFGIIGKIVSAISKVVGWIADGLAWVIELFFGGGGDTATAEAINAYATGGFTDGLSIAGEDPRYPTEAIISFNPAYRAQNLSYWARAGRMLGADTSDYYLGGSAGGTTIDFGGVTFAPHIVVNGDADKETIMEAIEEEYPEFCDMLERWLAERRAPVYG